MARERETEILTVAKVRDSGEILFNERQQIFTPSNAVKGSELTDLIKRKIPVRATLEPDRGTVEKIEMLEPREIDEFRRSIIPLENPSKAVKVDVRRLDPVLSNVVDVRLRWPVFNICVKTIPNFAKAQEIFDFCAAQTCSLGGPFDISPCIPFQYVKDGCFARAHKMRKIITEKYKYCCEKVFSFANEEPDKLAVKANKWGGCCVEWWYHVAPLVRVKFTFGRNASFTFAMVIDPGMFDAPVMLSTWLAAQENTTCNPNAHVTRYSIQSGAAYYPTDYSGLAFTTDSNYTATDAKLQQYANKVTC
jgi:hypothetical protein